MYRSSDIYEDIVKVIIEIYRDYDIKDFPIDEKDICRRLGVALVPYSEFPKEARALLEKKSKHGFFVRGTKKNPPTIYYNDKFEPYGAVRLTIFHELKHYVFDEDANDEDQDDLADFFGRYFLCPIPYLIMKGIDTENDIISHCGVSMTAAGNVESTIRNRKQRYGYRIFEHEIPFLKHLDEDAYEVFIRTHEEVVKLKDYFS